MQGVLGSHTRCTSCCTSRGKGSKSSPSHQHLCEFRKIIVVEVQEDVPDVIHDHPDTPHPVRDVLKGTGLFDGVRRENEVLRGETLAFQAPSEPTQNTLYGP